MLFEPDKKPNRRLTPAEMSTEIDICRWLKRPARTFFNDDPFYPWLPPAPKVPRVNFELNFEK